MISILEGRCSIPPDTAGRTQIRGGAHCGQSLSQSDNSRVNYGTCYAYVPSSSPSSIFPLHHILHIFPDNHPRAAIFTVNTALPLLLIIRISPPSLAAGDVTTVSAAPVPGTVGRRNGSSCLSTLSLFSGCNTWLSCDRLIALLLW